MNYISKRRLYDDLGLRMVPPLGVYYDIKMGAAQF